VKPLDPLTLPLTGSTLIEASAGTGKTYTITSIVLRLLIERGLDIGQILVVTYTRAATAELKTRIRARIAEALRVYRGKASDDELLEILFTRSRERNEAARDAARIERALAELDNAPVFTIHAFCQRALSDHAFESGVSFDAELTTDNSELVGEIADDYYQRELSDADDGVLEALASDTPETLRKIAWRTLGSSAWQVLPKELSDAHQADVERYEAQRERCRALWLSSRDTIIGLLASVHKNRKHLDGWISKMERRFERNETGFAGADDRSFQAFTASFIASKAKGAPPQHAFFDECEKWHEHDEALVRARKVLSLRFRKNFVAYARNELDRRMDREGARSFDTLLTALDRALHSERAELLKEKLRERYQVALVDEFQDTDPLQYRIFRALFAPEPQAHEHALFMIGDPKQAIYAFRGADVFAYLAARNDTSDSVYTLATNRRSDAALVSALNFVYGRVQRPFAIDGIDYHAVQSAKPQRLQADDGRAPIDLAFIDERDLSRAFTDEVAERIASDIVGLLMSGAQRKDDDHPERTVPRAVLPRDIAVLCRKNDEAKLVQQKLMELAVPSVMSGDASVLDSDDALEIERILLALAHPTDVRAMRSFLASSFTGLTATQIAALDEESQNAAWDEHRNHMHALHLIWLQRGFTQAMRSLSARYRIESILLTRPDGMRRITNLWHLVELISEAQVAHRLGPLGALRWLRSARDDRTQRAELVSESHELRLESSNDAVLLTTIHKSKGLEYPIVYIPFLWDGKLLKGDDGTLVRFHEGPEHTPMLDLGTDELAEHKKLAEREALAEGLRLVYVALTRARHRVVVVIPQAKQGSFAASALAYTLFGGGDAEPLAAELKELDAGALYARLEAMAQESARGVSLRLLPAALVTRRYEPHRRDVHVLEARIAKRVLDVAQRTASFSALTTRALSRKAEVGLDRDEAVVEPEQDSKPSPLLLDAFPRGAVAGELVHEVLEHHDFTSDRSALRELVEAKILARGYDAAWVDALVLGLEAALATELEPGLRMNTVPPTQRLNELEFILPVTRTLSARALSECFRQHGAPQTRSAYANELKALGFDDLRGFLRGFVDLVFRHEGRFYVVDYKSNHLGPLPNNYDREGLAHAMASHHYYLQYHLYVLALHRYLDTRLPSYSYERDFGGVYYLFLRGMAPDHPPGSGVYFDKPTLAMVQALDVLCGLNEHEARP
jgi:exodeoxyribonuclease V beta subunit